MKVDNDWNEMKTHNCRKGKDELERVYKRFMIEELHRVINKMKMKASGNDLVIDQFKNLGFGGKQKLLEIANKI